MTTPESLTEEERALLTAYARWAGQGEGTTSASAAAKLLRIHDRLQAENRDLREAHRERMRDGFNDTNRHVGLVNNLALLANRWRDSPGAGQTIAEEVDALLAAIAEWPDAIPSPVPDDRMTKP